jgi:hypothetical protein
MMVFKTSLTRFVKAGLWLALNFVNSHPKFHLYASAVIRKLRLDKMPRSIYLYQRLTMRADKQVHYLTPRASQIYLDLKKAIERLQQENR